MEKTKLVINNFDDLVSAYTRTVDDFFFIQIGANDGRNGDPLFKFVTELGWSGVLVEPQKLIFEERLLANYADCSDLSFENVAIDEEDGQREIFQLSFSQKRWATGLASFKKSHLQDHIDNGYIERSIGDERDKLPSNELDYICSDTVTTMSFKTLIDKYRIQNLDLLQIDTEGYDYHLLKMYDFDRLRPAIVQFEHHVMTEEQRLSSRNMLGAYGYLTFIDHINIVGIQRHLARRLGLDFDVTDIRNN